MSLVGGLVGGGLSLVGGLLGADASKDAAEASAAASRYAADLQWKQYNQTREDMTPWREAGVNALADFSGYGRSQVAPGDYIPDSNIPVYDPNIDLSKDPSYLWRQSEQERMINRNLAGMGKLTSGNRLDEIMKRSGEMASQEYSNAYNRNMNDYNVQRTNEATNYARGVDDYGRAYGEEADYLNRLASVSNIGQTAATDTGRFGANAAANAGAAYQSAGNAYGAGQIGQANAWGNALGDIGALVGSGAFDGAFSQPDIGGDVTDGRYSYNVWGD